MPEFIVSLATVDNLYTAIVVIVVMFVGPLARRLIDGWVSNRTEDEKHERETDLTTRGELREAQEEIRKLYLSRIETLEAQMKTEVKHWRDEAQYWQLQSQKWYTQHLSSIAIAQDQRTIIKELEERADRQSVKIEQLTERLSMIENRQNGGDFEY